MEEEDEDQEEFKQGMIESIKAQYTDILKTTDLDNLFVCSLLKISKVAVEIEEVSHAFHDDEIRCSALEALIRLEVLLGAANEVRIEIKKSL